MRYALAAFTLLFASPVFAQGLAEQRYAAADLTGAADAGELAGDTANLTLASRALLALAMRDLHQPRCAAWLDRAEADAARALTLAPDAVEPRLNLALALGMKGRRASLREALSQHYAARGKVLIDEALTMASEEARGYALLGAWNLEILRRGGPVGAKLMGASAKAGIRAFEQARALASASAAIALHYALGLLAVDAKRYEPQARDLLAAASFADARDPFDVTARDEARRLEAVMTSQGAAAAAESAARNFL
jgi:hypothetical protein